VKKFKDQPPTIRTVIYRTVAQEVSDNRKSLDLSIEMAEQLAHWISMEAAKFEAFDERTHGYQDLAERLLAR